MASPPVDPVDPTVPAPAQALREIGFWLERERADSYRVKAYRGAADALDALPTEDLAALQEADAWADVPGLGRSTVAVIRESLAGRLPQRLAELRRAGARPLADSGLRHLVRGDLHCHTTWSDGGSPLAEMAVTAERLGHDYLAITDHSPRLRVAHGLDAERLAAQWREIDRVQAALAERGSRLRLLKGIEVDILDDGSLDQSEQMLAGLDVVVASVHSKLRGDRDFMTRRLVAAVANPHTTVLGHCTGRLVEGSRGTRPPSDFDAEVVFEACRQFDVAVEINSRPERQDPPDPLLALARDIGCRFSIDTDAHAPGQLDFLALGCARAEAAGISPERIITTWPVDELLAFAAR
ncbi:MULTISPECIES: PHP domain-containing protein [unclassified Luteococcus]|uniref:PHP domain-containing protein n=1 Tax=unclassified Luteococcus TaxID=2639923 RepID=UPI00313ABCD4